MVEVFKLFLAKLHISIKLGRVSKVAHPCLVRKHRHHTVISLYDSRRAVDMHLTKLNLVDNILIRVPLLLACGVLGDLFNLDLTILHDDILQVEFQKAVEAADLL